MQITVALDDELVAKAKAYTGLSDGALVLDRALRALIERESARRLADAGGSEPNLTDVPRRRSFE
jgi:Arc/MetJ family transcription regulator